MTDDAPTTKPDADYRPLTPEQRASLDLADAAESVRVAADEAWAAGLKDLTVAERADLEAAQMHLAKVQRSLQQRRDGRGT